MGSREGFPGRSYHKGWIRANSSPRHPAIRDGFARTVPREIPPYGMDSRERSPPRSYHMGWTRANSFPGHPSIRDGFARTVPQKIPP
jgi:hypothetical protein